MEVRYSFRVEFHPKKYMNYGERTLFETVNYQVRISLFSLFLDYKSRLSFILESKC